MVELYRQGKTEALGANPVPLPLRPPKSPTQTGLRLIPVPHGECPATTMRIVFKDSVRTAQETPRGL